MSFAPRVRTYLPEEELVRGVGRAVEGAVDGGTGEDDGALQRDAQEEPLLYDVCVWELCACVWVLVWRVFDRGCEFGPHIPTNSNLAHLALAVREGRADDAAPPRVEVRGGRSAQGAERDGQLRSDRQLLIIVVWDTWFGG